MNLERIKIFLLCAAIILVSFHHNCKSLHRGMQRYNRKALDEITEYEKRYRGLKAVLQNQAIVGYVSDLIDGSDEDEIAYTITQYVLVPIILVRGKRPDFIIGNFQRAKPDIKAYEKENLSLHRDFGNGVMLFERMDS